MGDRIYALGGGIGNSREEFETETTLFQVASRVGLAQLNGKSLLKTSTHALKSGDQLISPNGHGYLMLEDRELGVHVGTQISEHNKTMKETRGDFSMAWLKHCKARSGGTYEYVLFPKATSKTMDAWKNRMK